MKNGDVFFGILRYGLHVWSVIPFFAFFTYTVNEGLIVRQRIQLYPALLVLLATPILQRRELNREGAKDAKVN